MQAIWYELYKYKTNCKHFAKYLLILSPKLHFSSSAKYMNVFGRQLVNKQVFQPCFLIKYLRLSRLSCTLAPSSAKIFGIWQCTTTHSSDENAKKALWSCTTLKLSAELKKLCSISYMKNASKSKMISADVFSDFFQSLCCRREFGHATWKWKDGGSSCSTAGQFGKNAEAESIGIKDLSPIYLYSHLSQTEMITISFSIMKKKIFKAVNLE